jgi:hypothetical protein
LRLPHRHAAHYRGLRVADYFHVSGVHALVELHGRDLCELQPT